MPFFLEQCSKMRHALWKKVRVNRYLSIFCQYLSVFCQYIMILYICTHIITSSNNIYIYRHIVPIGNSLLADLLLALLGRAKKHFGKNMMSHNWGRLICLQHLGRHAAPWAWWVPWVADAIGSRPTANCE